MSPCLLREEPASSFVSLTIVSVFICLSLKSPVEAAAPQRFTVVKSGRPACRLLSSCNTELSRRAVQAVVEGVRDVSGVTLPVESARLPRHVLWALVEGTRPKVIVSIPQDRSTKTGEATADSFAIRRRDHAVILVAPNDRSGFYGSVYLRDTLLKAVGQDVFLDQFPRLVSPLRVRGTYNLACWGRSPEYRRQDWESILDAMAEDGMNTIYFWLSGLFRSQRHPEAFTYKQTAMTTEDLRQLIRYAHSRGINFLLGSGVFAWLAIDALADAYPETRATGVGGMCPSNERARQLNLEYLLELYDALPEADGLFLEIRDEYGACKCLRCQATARGGGRQYGQSELSFLQELGNAVWKSHPRANLVWCIGYSESHADDRHYYERLRTFADSRFNWLVVRGNWELPGTDGKNHPLTHFSPHMIHWTQYYTIPLEDLRSWLQRSARERLLGACAAFEPGFSSASYYSDDIPFPVDTLPYVLTRFIYRTFSWEPDLTMEKFRQRLQRKFFTPEVSPQLADDLLYLFDLVRTVSTSNQLREAGRWEHGVLERQLTQAESETGAKSPDEWGTLCDRLANLTALADRTEPHLREIESRLASQRPISIRSQRSLGMMHRCVEDTRRELLLAPELQARVRSLSKRANQCREEILGRGIRVDATSEWNHSNHSCWKVIDGDRNTSWLAADHAALPVTLTIEFKEAIEISKVRLVQGAYHEAYNTRAYRVEVSADGKTFERVAEGEFANVRGEERSHTLKRIPCRALRVVITSVYPNVAYSSPSLAEVAWE